MARVFQCLRSRNTDEAKNDTPFPYHEANLISEAERAHTNLRAVSRLYQFPSRHAYKHRAPFACRHQNLALSSPHVRGRPGAARKRSALMAEKGAVVVTDGTDSFFDSRQLFQSLYDFGDFSSITAFSSSAENAKKMLLTRDSRYTGLYQDTHFAEGGDEEFIETLQKADIWIAVNANEEDIEAKLKAAQKAGIKRVFIHIFASESDEVHPTKVEGFLTKCRSPIEYTLMRTGRFTTAAETRGLKLQDLEADDVTEISKEEAFRIITELVTLEEANGRVFSLTCPDDDWGLKKMRQAGCTPREEVVALLKGEIEEKPDEDEDAKKKKKAAEEDKIEPLSQEAMEELVRKSREEAAERKAKEEEAKAAAEEAAKAEAE